MIVEKMMEPEETARYPGDQLDTLLFDEEQLLRNFDDDKEFLESILNDAMEEIPVEVDKLQEACGGEDLQAIRNRAHTIKGMGANLCTPALREIAHKIETAAKDGDVAEARELLPELAKTMRLTLEEIKRQC